MLLDRLKTLFRMALIGKTMQQTNKDLQTVTQEIANSSQYQEIERFIQEAKQDPRNPGFVWFFVRQFLWLLQNR